MISVSREHTVGDCMKIITEKRNPASSVLEGSAVVGVVSIGDLVNSMISEQARTIEHLEAYISGVAM